MIYYKGKMRKVKYRPQRLSDDPHYFGTARIGDVYEDPDSEDNYHFAEVVDFRPFSKAVPNKRDGEYFEHIPPSKEANYWRDGVREISEATYRQVVEAAGDARGLAAPSPGEDADTYDFESSEEGRATRRYVKTYERDPELRRQAIVLNGLSCEGCSFNFADTYGEWGRGFIHVHHVKPLSEADGQHDVNPKTDLKPLCPNCHAMVHRRQDKTLTIDELKSLLSTHANAEN